jgi:predicted DCC family thiol-disulfide oxidoreductase YuxK
LTTTARLIVWYDAGCLLCQREIALMRRLDRGGQIDFIDVTDPAAACPLDPADMLARFHATEDGRLLSGAAAFAAMWRAIPLLRPLGLVARWRPLERALEWAYVRFLRVRPRIQRRLNQRALRQRSEQ